jgi:regulator of protease activity HflC (stomatin/prohibitin superfamily)
VDADVATNDGVALTVTGELQGQVVDPVAAVRNVVDYEDATRQILQTAMRALVMRRSSAELSEGRQLHPDVADEVVDAVLSWGVDVLSLSFDVAAAPTG